MLSNSKLKPMYENINPEHKKMLFRVTLYIHDKKIEVF